MTPNEYYSERIGSLDAQATRHRQSFQRLGNTRLFVAVALALIAAASWGYSLFSPWFLLVPIAFLIGLTLALDRAERLQTEAARAQRYFHLGLARISGAWRGKGSPGERFRSSEHLYADDLDLFGAASLFEYLCVARTAAGERNLAAWLLEPASAEVARLRQSAIRELAKHTTLREELALLGDDVRDAANDDQVLNAWGQALSVSFPAFALWAARGLAIAALVTLIAWLGQLWPISIFLGVVLVELLFSARFRERVEQIHSQAGRPARELRLIRVVLERIARERFEDPMLVSLHLDIAAGVAPVGRLLKLAEQLEWLRNDFFKMVASPLLWEMRVSIAVEQWRSRHGAEIGNWMRALGEFEALCSLATYAFEHADACYPELESGSVFEVHGLVHPLLPRESAVANDVKLGDPPLWILSGSNMSGKSTLLRAIGTAVVLAWAGAPVAASRARVSRLRIGASLRTSDSLADHRSRFYAEILRLRAIAALAETGEPTLFLLDELLSGTNSQDRRTGAEALVRSLAASGAIGIVTTHDLALAEIAGKIPQGALNMHLEDWLDGAEIRFDYKLKPGIVTRGNALALMRAIGLEV